VRILGRPAEIRTGYFPPKTESVTLQEEEWREGRSWLWWSEFGESMGHVAGYLLAILKLRVRFPENSVVT